MNWFFLRKQILSRIKTRILYLYVDVKWEGKKKWNLFLLWNIPNVFSSLWRESPIQEAGKSLKWESANNWSLLATEPRNTVEFTQHSWMLNCTGTSIIFPYEKYSQTTSQMIYNAPSKRMPPDHSKKFNKKQVLKLPPNWYKINIHYIVLHSKKWHFIQLWHPEPGQPPV